MVVHRQLEAFSRLHVVSVVKGLGVEKDAEAVCFANLFRGEKGSDRLGFM
jgi:hypothetical protein